MTTEKVDSSVVRHPNGEKVAGSFADRPCVPDHDKVHIHPGDAEVTCHARDVWLLGNIHEPTQPAYLPRFVWIYL